MYTLYYILASELQKAFCQILAALALTCSLSAMYKNQSLLLLATFTKN